MLRTAAVLIAMLVTAIAISACGGSSPTGKSQSSQTAGRTAAVRLSECMRTHGVPQFPDLGSHGGFGIQLAAHGAGASVTVDGHTLNVSGPAFERAMRECAKYGPKGPAISGSQLAKIRRGALRMAQCMRSHGVPDFPDPQVTVGPGGHGIGIRIGGPKVGGVAGGIDPSSPAFQKAQKTCGALLGGYGPKTRRAA